jgi:molecular chaperone DnaK (HSP70)
MKKADIDEIVMIGGSTYIPKVRNIVEEYFGKPLNYSVNPDEAVCAGAAIQAAILSGYRDKHIQNLFLLDIVPLNLGINVQSGLLEVVVKKNTPIPIKIPKIFTNPIDNCSSVQIQVYEGNRVVSEDNHKLGDFILSNIAQVPKNEAIIEVTFTIDANGILNVSA